MILTAEPLAAGPAEAEFAPAGADAPALTAATADDDALSVLLVELQELTVAAQAAIPSARTVRRLCLARCVIGLSFA